MTDKHNSNRFKIQSDSDSSSEEPVVKKNMLIRRKINYDNVTENKSETKLNTECHDRHESRTEMSNSKTINNRHDFDLSDKLPKGRNHEGFVSHRKNFSRVENFVRDDIRNKQKYEGKKIYEPLPDVDYGNELYFACPWNVWVHPNSNSSWDESSYKHIYTINSVGSFHRFFNHFHILNKEQYQYFIMRDQIKPIWEDNENRHGGICSCKLDQFYIKNKHIDIAVHAMLSMCLMAMNETFINTTNQINGFSYSIKTRSAFIKIWYKHHDDKNDKNIFTDLLPLKLFTSINKLLVDNSSNYQTGNRGNIGNDMARGNATGKVKGVNPEDGNKYKPLSIMNKSIMSIKPN